MCFPVRFADLELELLIGLTKNSRFMSGRVMWKDSKVRYFYVIIDTVARNSYMVHRVG